MQRILKYFLFLFLTGVLFLSPFYLPFFQERDPGFQAKDLSGTFEKVSRPSMTGQSWLDKSFQKDFEKNRKQESSITPLFVRGKNELDYQLFNHINTDKTLAGKNGFLYSNDYCESYIGKDFLGEENIQQTVEKLRFVCESLNKIGIRCLVLNPPGKPRARPEFLPNFYQNYPKKSSNWEVFNRKLKKAEIPILDLKFLLNPYQYEQKELPLYPTLGLHWNYLGAILTVQHLNEYFKKDFGFSTSTMNYDLEFRTPKEMLGTDLEMLHGSNLLLDLDSEIMPYPDWKFEKDSIVELPNVLIIGDSYYKIIYDYGLQDGVFHKNSEFFYYYQQRFPKKKRLPNDLSISETLKNRDLIIFSHAEFNLDRFGFGFLDRLYEHFTQSPSTKPH